MEGTSDEFLTKPSEKRDSLMEPAQAESSLKVAKVCREQCYLDSAASRAYFAMFEAVVCALEAYGVHRAEWSHKALHAAVAGVLIRRRKVVPAVLVGALPSAMEIRHAAD